MSADTCGGQSELDKRGAREIEGAQGPRGAEQGMQLRICHLYPELMSTYGDRGNVIALERRAEWSGMRVRTDEVSVGDALPEDCDFYFIGGGQDLAQGTVAEDLCREKAGALRRVWDAGAVIFSICGGYQLLGRAYRDAHGGLLEGIGILDVETVARPGRLIGDVVARSALEGSEGKTLVGFENHGGRTYLGPEARPLARVVRGAGNNGGDGTEGAVQGTCYGTYLHGAMLPKNPWLADHLLRRALARRHSSFELPSLDDSLEERLHASRTAIR
ncbi:MAG: glutamine amidotransferase [Actinomycetota bacterium]